jgi:phage tail sheath protein FI
VALRERRAPCRESGGAIDEGLAWTAFEPNDEATWASVERFVENYLTDRWHEGALRGATPDDAFFVRCDRSTATQADLDAGRLVVRVGVAAVRPAEFTVFEVTQATGVSRRGRGLDPASGARRTRGRAPP